MDLFLEQIFPVVLMYPLFCLRCRNDGTEFGGSIYQKVSDDLETAVNLSWTAGNSSTRFGIAAKYMLDSSSSISVSFCCCGSFPLIPWIDHNRTVKPRCVFCVSSQAKVNNSSLVGIGYTQTLRPGECVCVIFFV